jgi:hypothetical protein
MPGGIRHPGFRQRLHPGLLSDDASRLGAGVLELADRSFMAAPDAVRGA